jgi:glucosamine--fructose-6-phosphate aminotransferase (isomerizing)
MEKVLDRHAEIEASARRLAVTKRYWAVVGSGPNKASADEIRIKLSELCYKTISSDMVEYKKHIDLSAEPLIVVCAAGSRDEVLGDMVKDTAIFKAHRAVPIVIATEGEHRFDPYADTVLHVPAVHAGLAPILNTLAGHLWGYYAALSIHEESRHLFAFREAIRQHVAAAVGQGRDLYEIVLDDTFREQVAAFDHVFKDKLRQDRYATALSIQTASDLTLLLKYMAGRLPSSDFEGDFGVKGTPPNILDTFFACMGKIIGELTRPVDAIKHQAKTVTVGTSRLADKVEGLLFDALGQNGFETGQLSTANVVVLRRLQEVVGAINGTTLYRIAGLNLLGKPVDTSTIALEHKAGSSALLPSRVESDTRLRGTKRIIVQNGNVFIGKGRRDQRSILVIPLMSTATTIDYLLLLHVGFRPDVALDKKVAALGGKYQHIRHLVEETRFTWHDDYLNRLEMEELFGWSAEKVSERILAVLRTDSAAAIVSNPS